MTIFGLTLEQWANFKFYIGLAGPLLLVVYLPIVLAGLFFLATRKWRWWMKVPILLAYIAVTYAVPLGDVTVNSMNMAKMCGDSGLHIYRSVEVDGFYGGLAPLEILDKNKYKFIEDIYLGRVTRYERNGSLINKISMAAPSAEWEYHNGIGVPNRKFGVTETHSYIKSRFTNEVIAEHFGFSPWRGWIDQEIGRLIDNYSEGCGWSTDLLSVRSKILIPHGSDQ